MLRTGETKMKLTKTDDSRAFQAELDSIRSHIHMLSDQETQSFFLFSKWFPNIFRGLLQLWSLNYVPTELICFIHEKESRIYIVWNNEVKNGILHHNLYVNNYLKGISNTNIAVGVKKETGEPFSHILDIEDHVESVEKNSQGFSLLASSLTQWLILLIHFSIRQGMATNSLRQLLSLTILNTFLEYFSNDDDKQRFLSLLENFDFDSMFTEVQNAIQSDRLKVFPFIMPVEKFILSNSLLLDNERLINHIKGLSQ
jgi:hypothetical protein